MLYLQNIGTLPLFLHLLSILLLFSFTIKTIFNILVYFGHLSIPSLILHINDFLISLVIHFSIVVVRHILYIIDLPLSSILFKKIIEFTTIFIPTSQILTTVYPSPLIPVIVAQNIRNVPLTTITVPIIVYHILLIPLILLVVPHILMYQL